MLLLLTMIIKKINLKYKNELRQINENFVIFWSRISRDRLRGDGYYNNQNTFYNTISYFNNS